MKKLLSVLLCLGVLLSTAPVAGISAYAAVTPKISFSRSSNLTLTVGDTHHRPAKVTPSGAAVTYSSSDEDVATVDSSGKVTAVAVGRTVITAKSGTLSTSYNLAVVKKPGNVRISASQKWVRVGRTIQLDVDVYPRGYEYDSVEWYTLDYDIISIDDYGEVTGLKPGIATVEARVYVDGTAKEFEIGTAEIQIEVRGAVTSSYSSDDFEFDPDSLTISLDTSTTPENKNIIPTKTVNDAVKKALKAGTTTSATFKNYKAVSTVSLESAAAEMQLGGGVVLLNFDTLSADGKSTEGRLTINPRAYKPVTYKDPLQVGHSINVTLYTNDGAVLDVRNKFQKFYKNEMLVMKAGKKDEYGMNVTCTVNAGNLFSKAKISNLKLYSYDPDNGEGGKYRLVKNANISIDDKKNLHFTTDVGGYLIISNGALAKK